MFTEHKSHHFLVDKNGKPEAVVLSFATYEKLVRLTEDREDAAALRKAMRTTRTTLSHKDLMAHLKQRGLL